MRNLKYIPKKCLCMTMVNCLQNSYVDFSTDSMDEDEEDVDEADDVEDPMYRYETNDFTASLVLSENLFVIVADRTKSKPALGSIDSQLSSLNLDEVSFVLNLSRTKIPCR